HPRLVPRPTKGDVTMGRQRKMADDDAAETTSDVAPAGDAAETPRENPTVFKCGPIPTRKGESVQGCVSEKAFLTPNGRSYRVHSIEVRASYFSEKDGQWYDSKGFKPSQLSALEFVLRRCGDFCF